MWFLFSILINCRLFLCGEIIQIERISDILSAVETDTLVLFDMDDTLTDSTSSL